MKSSKNRFTKFVTRFNLDPCPAYSLYLSADSVYTLQSNQFWWSLGLIHGLTWLLLWLASWIAPHSWQDQPAGAGARPWRDFWQSWRYGKAAQRQAFRKRLLDENAFYWLAARARLKPAQVWTFLGVMAGWWLVGRVTAGTIWRDIPPKIMTDSDKATLSDINRAEFVNDTS